MKVVGAYAVAGEQQPARETRFDLMETVARGALPGLHQLGEGIPEDLALQGKATPERLAEARRLHAQRAARSMNLGPHRRNVGSQRERNADHAFPPDEAHFQRL